MRVQGETISGRVTIRPPATGSGHRRRGRVVLFAVCATAALLAAVGVANGAVGDLTYQGCISGETQTGPTGTNACAQISGASASGANSGLDNLLGAAVSPDGKSVYTASSNDASVGRFDRNTTTGSLTYQGCITGETESGPASPPPGSGACAEVVSASSGGANSGLQGLQAVAVSPDDKSVYAVSQEDNAIVRFNRDTSTGALTYQGCITGETQSGPSGSNACTQIATAASNGDNSGLDLLNGVTVSPDGKSVYVTSSGDDAVARFDRDTNGAVSYQGCITGQTDSGPSGSGACAQIGSAATEGANSGLDSPASPMVSPDSNGTSVYTATSLDDSVGRFDRNTTTGALTYQGCITGETQSGPTGSNACDQIGSAASSGGNSGLDQLSSVAVAADGASLYTLSTADDAAARFSRAASGALTYQGCISGETGSGGSCTLLPSAQLNTDSGLDNGNSILASADGRSLYAATSGDDSMVRFDREPVPPDSDGDGVPDSSDACPAEPGPASNGGCPLPTPPPPDTGGGGVTDTSAPSTTITAGPKAKTKKKTATFEFTSTEPGSTFECKLDDGSFQSCTSPHDVKVGKGKHTFEVRAKDAAGNVDPTPAQQSWTVKKKKKK